MVADIEVDMVADMEVDKVVDIEVDIVTDINIDINIDIDIDIDINVNINMEIQFGERVGHGGWLIWSKLFRPKAYPACASSKLSEFIWGAGSKNTMLNIVPSFFQIKRKVLK